MSQRNSEYPRQAADAYWTPQWVYDALYAVEDFAGAWDCAPRDADFNFLELDECASLIATNPPYSLATEFCRHAISATHDLNGKCAMLLPMTFDCAKGRRDLFAHPFAAKYTLTKRIRWENLVQKKNGPSSNHAWFVWDWAHQGKPSMGWLP